MTATIENKRVVELTGEAGLFKLSWRALGSPCLVQFTAPRRVSAPDLARAVVEWVEDFEARYSRFRPDSLLSRINASAGRGWVPIDGEMEGMLDLCHSLFFASNGRMDPTALPVINLYYERTALPAPTEVAEAMRRVGWDKVQVEPGRVLLSEPGMALDFGCFGKEYAVDAVFDRMRAAGVDNVLVDFGRDIRVLGQPPGKPCWHIGVENPKAPGQSLMGLGLVEGAVAASGNYRRCFTVDGRRYGHIVDPRTGEPVFNDVVAVHVIAGSCLEAGLRSTSAFIMGVPEGLDMLEMAYGVEGLIICETRSFQTGGFHPYIVSTP